jgi:hypothetical protein
MGKSQTQSPVVKNLYLSQTYERTHKFLCEIKHSLKKQTSIRKIVETHRSSKIQSQNQNAKKKKKSH